MLLAENTFCNFTVIIYRVGPTSPIGWIRENILQIIPEHSEKRKKILLGLNFYGYDFGGASGIQGESHVQFSIQ